MGGARTSCGLIVGFSGAARHCQGGGGWRVGETVREECWGGRVVLVVNGNWGAGRGRRVEFGYVSAKTFDGTDFKPR